MVSDPHREINEPVSRADFDTLASGNRLTYTDASGTWSGIALWRLLARVDDSDPGSFNDTEADLGYTVTLLAGDGYSKSFTSTILKRNDTWIIADTLNGNPRPGTPVQPEQTLVADPSRRQQPDQRAEGCKHYHDHP